MKDSYSIRLSITKLAIADLCQYLIGSLCKEDPWWITRINVPKQYGGKGHGTTLLKRIVSDADHEGVTLMLEIAPSDGLSRNQLQNWYCRYGFKKVVDGPLKGAYVRKPATNS